MFLLTFCHNFTSATRTKIMTSIFETPCIIIFGFLHEGIRRELIEVHGDSR